MQILNADQIRAWDQYTIDHEPISSIDLMERAASKCVEWIENRNWEKKVFYVFAGPGNNGGDGLAIARMLLKKNHSVFVFIMETGKPGSSDFETNLLRLQSSGEDVQFLSDLNFPPIPNEAIVIDALFGSGLNKQLNGSFATIVEHINNSNATVVAIDIPSGLFIDQTSSGTTIIKADHTLTFQCYKLGLLLPENAEFTGEVHILDIGLHPGYLNTIDITRSIIDAPLIKKIYKPRKPFSHKGTYGHALIVAGSYGKIGAAILTTKACVTIGAGLTTAFIPGCGYPIMQASVPEAMVITVLNDENEFRISSLPDDVEKYSSIGVGPGIGTIEETCKVLSFIFRRYSKPIVIDADALNCLALQPDTLRHLPSHSIITPHPKEFERLFGTHHTDFERVSAAKQFAADLNIIIILKGHRSLIALPDGRIYFNTTGNAGLAKGGSGDVLTGMLTGLLAQGYSPEKAALFGVYLHGLSADCAAEKMALETITASDVIKFLSDAFLLVNDQS